MNSLFHRYPRALTLTACNLVAAAGALGAADFNGDGFDDLAIGAPGETIGGKMAAGQVHVIYGSATGLSATASVADQVFNQDTPGVNQTLEANDRFGDALTTGDFNGDGFDDLAIGSPFEAITMGGVDHPQAGVVNILYGSAQGLTSANDQDFIQGSEGVGGAVADFNWFGWALAAADFDHDGFEDLAVGIPGQDVGTVGMAGAVTILYGSASGLASRDGYLVSQDTNSMLGQCETMDRFGLVLAAADFGDDGFADLAVGIPDESVTVNGQDRSFAGVVQVLYGTSAGLVTVVPEMGLVINNEIWSQDSTDVIGSVQQGDRFGSSLAASHVGSKSLLAIGAPSDKDAKNGSGSVTVLFGNIKSDRLTGTGCKRVRLEDLGILDVTSDDAFGAEVAAADFGRPFQNGDLMEGGVDLAIGAPERKVKKADGSTVFGAGSVYVLYRTATGFSAPGFQLIAQGLSGLPGTPEIGDDFGTAMATGRFKGGTQSSLVIGSPFDSEVAFHAGGIHVLAGSTNGLGIGTGQRLTQNTANVEDASESSDAFGLSLGSR